jgi:hypothetical protein
MEAALISICVGCGAEMKMIPGWVSSTDCAGSFSVFDSDFFAGYFCEDQKNIQKRRRKKRKKKTEKERKRKKEKLFSSL